MQVQFQENMNTLVTLQLQLVRIEEGIKPLAALVPAVAEVRDVSKEALQTAQQTAAKVIELEAELKKTADVAYEAKRRAEDALSRLDKQEKWNDWLKKAFLGPVITTLLGLVITAVWAVFKLS
ncbi:hypothetical protein [Paenibacillus xylanilyticus]|uniref:Uncharacterized protein n=1 Tax=Paenibacillus xylanilyticus TaxID=248903 RepID=A0A7Y6EUI9_9BACL|nr:hypothetical protein [Paenibacillus xylanilyticus]NUU74783.1 hypothetical protein [Paenibacillus xylanilyticus]